MSITYREIAKEYGVSVPTIRNHLEKLNMSKDHLTEDDRKILAREVLKNVDLKAENAKKLRELEAHNETFEPNLRRIDQSNASSIPSMLQDAKERYVKNEELIQRLQYEIDSQATLMNGNQNGTVSSMPQLATIEKFIKSNINLRNQILELESILGKNAEGEEGDPFN